MLTFPLPSFIYFCGQWSPKKAPREPGLQTPIPCWAGCVWPLTSRGSGDNAVWCSRPGHQSRSPAAALGPPETLAHWGAASRTQLLSLDGESMRSCSGAFAALLGNCQYRLTAMPMRHRASSSVKPSVAPTPAIAGETQVRATLSTLEPR